MALKKRQKDILAALTELGEATTRQIADKTGLNTNGVAQSLGTMSEHVVRLDGRAGATRWRLKTLGEQTVGAVQLAIPLRR